MCLNKLPEKNGVFSHEGQILKGSTHLQWLCLEGMMPHRFSALRGKCDEWVSCLKDARKLGEVKAMYAAGPEHKSESTELILLHWNDFANRVIEEDAINMPG